jgi:uncharacterized protein (DUF58 family)
MDRATLSTLLSPELLARLEKMELVSRKIFRGRMKGERRSPRKGQSVEFADFRNYVSGDDLRFVDWNTYARLEKLFLKMFLEEEDLHFYALIDASSSMDFGTPTKLHFALQLAAALGFIGLVRGDRVKIETIGQSPPNAAPAFRGRRSLWRMLDHLEGIAEKIAEKGTSLISEAGGQGEKGVRPHLCAAPAGPFRQMGSDPFFAQKSVMSPFSLAEGVKGFCLRNSGKGIVVLISDLMDKHGYESALRYLASRQMDVYVIHVLSPEEFEPDIQGDLRLVDCEDGDVAEVTVTGPLLKRYRQTLASFIESARDFCSRRGMTYLLARSETSVEELLTGYLATRGLVR